MFYSILTATKIFVLHALCYSTTFVAYKVAKKSARQYPHNYEHLGITLWVGMISMWLTIAFISVTETWHVFYAPTMFISGILAAIGYVFGSVVGNLMYWDVYRKEELEEYRRLLPIYKADPKRYTIWQEEVERLVEESKVYNPKDNDFMRVYRHLLSVLQRKRTP